MDLINKTEWTEQDILDLIATKAEENIHLDFKAADALTKRDGNISKKAEISKDVSAFANSDGGIIIYGLIEEDHVASKVDFIDGNEFTKEWLELVINGGIQRTIDGLRIVPIRFDNDIRKSIYVVIIPVSYNAPHINKDKKFYRRYDFQSVPMEEYEIRNLYNRKQNASVEFSSIFTSIKNLNTVRDDKELNFELSFHAINTGNNIAEFYKVNVLIGGFFGLHVSSQMDCSIVRDDLDVIISNKEFVPLFPDEMILILKFNIKIKFEDWDSFLSATESYAFIFSGNAKRGTDFDIKDIAKELLNKNSIAIV